MPNVVNLQNLGLVKEPNRYMHAKKLEKKSQNSVNVGLSFEDFQRSFKDEKHPYALGLLKETGSEELLGT